MRSRVLRYEASFAVKCRFARPSPSPPPTPNPLLAAHFLRILCSWETRFEGVVFYSSRGMTWDEVVSTLGTGRLRDRVWRAALSAFLMRPNPATSELLRAKRATVRWPATATATAATASAASSSSSSMAPLLVGLHVRQGDKFVELNNNVVPLKWYVTLLRCLTYAHSPCLLTQHTILLLMISL